MGNQFDLILLVKQRFPGLRCFEINAQWRKFANIFLATKFASCANANLELSEFARGIRELKFARKFLVEWTVRQQCRHRRDYSDLKNIVTLK
jgi:hypothetical protein